MGRSNKRKRAKLGTVAASAEAPPATTLVDNGHDSEEDDGLPSPDEVETAILVVRYLGKRPELFQHRCFKELRAALHPLVELQRRRYDPVDYTARITAALRSGKWLDALQALKGLRTNGCAQGAVKQGTLQRWVRDCSGVSDDAMRLRLLESVLRAGKADGGSGESGASGEAGGGGEASGGGEVCDEGEAINAREGAVEAGAEPKGDVHVRRHPSWVPPHSVAASSGEGSGSGGAAEASSEVEAGEALQVSSEAELARRVVLFEKGSERQPAGYRDRSIFACAPGSVRLAVRAGAAAAARRVERHDVPHVPGAFVLTGVLSPAECAGLIKMVEWLGFEPDHPVGQPAPTPIGTCEWAVDEHVLGPLFARCRAHLPPRLGGHEPSGLNGHLRCFRYPDQPGAVYRPHIDGSWPRSGLDTSGAYSQDEVELHSKPGAGGRSRLTFLVYLNEDFEGGATSFYLPAATGGLEAHCVQPRAGAVLCFPQGNTASLVHEGSQVTRGIKWVIRTDVLFQEPVAVAASSAHARLPEL